MSLKICDKCEITLAFPVGKPPKQINFMSVSNNSTNTVLVEILKLKACFIRGNRFIIIVDGSRYGIEIVNVTSDVIYLKQFFLHYDGGKLVPFVVRLVKIHNPKDHN